VSLVDERFVNNKSEFSNEKLVRESLLANLSEMNFIPMVFDEANESKNLELSTKAFEKLYRFNGRPAISTTGTPVAGISRPTRPRLNVQPRD
jgi:6-phosphogluconolactonase/glucosamine-6-phosphate isomerase/deaminase